MIPIFKSQRRRRLLDKNIPDHWLALVTDYLPIFEYFPDDQARRFLSHLKIFIWEKLWVGAGGIEVDEVIKVTIATQAARMARGLPLSTFDRHREFVIYPNPFVNPDEDALPGPLYGEAHAFGTVVLSWPAIQSELDYPCSGHSTILHEMAHILDLSSGYFDGTPILRRPEDYRPWAAACQKYFLAMRERPEESFLDLYGAADESEFFAVATEAFFGLPEIVADQAPDLFAEFRRYYGVDPLIIECDCQSHDPRDDEDYQEMGYPIIPPGDPMEGSYF